MRFQKIKSDSFCVGGRHRSATTKVFGDITSKVSKILIGFCSIFNREKSMTVGGNTIKVKSLSVFFKNLGKNWPNVIKRCQKTF